MKLSILSIVVGVALGSSPAIARPPLRRGAPARVAPAVPAPPVDAAQLSAFLDRAATFQDQQQCAATGDACYGAVHEIEGQPPFSELDTVEGLLVWAVHQQRVGRADHAPARERAWQYLTAHPPAQIGPPAYYQVYACALAVYEILEEDRATGQRAHDAALAPCRAILEAAGTSLALSADQLAEPAAMALAGSALYELGEARGDDAAKTAGAALGQRAKAWLDADPAGLASSSQFAMTGGTVYFGVMRSYLRAHPEQSAWAEQVGAQLGGFDDVPDATIPRSSDDWRNAYSAWNMAAQLEAARHTTGAVAEEHKRQFRCILARLVQQDTDGDGGIPGSIARPSSEDQGWISAYAVWMGVGPALAEPTLLSGDGCPTVPNPDGGAGAAGAGGGSGSGGGAAGSAGAGAAGSAGAAGGAGTAGGAGAGAAGGGVGGDSGAAGEGGGAGAGASAGGAGASGGTPPRRESGCGAAGRPAGPAGAWTMALLVLLRALVRSRPSAQPARDQQP